MIALKINDQETTLNTEWPEVTVRQYRELVRHAHEKNPLRVLSIMLKIPYNTLLNADCQGKELTLLQLMNFIREPVEWKQLQRPSVLNILGKQIIPPQSIEAETFGQKIIAHMKLQETLKAGESVPVSELISFILANYLQQKIDGTKLFDDVRAGELEEIIDELPVIECYPWADFFLSSCIQSLKQSPSDSKLITIVTRDKPES